jgi:uncharacterized linocin/CFP29 family protein
MFIDMTLGRAGVGQMINDGAHVMVGNRGIQGFGIGSDMGLVKYDPGASRPYRNNRGKPVCTINVGVKYDPKTKEFRPQFKEVRVEALQDMGYSSPTYNAVSMTKEAWLYLDRQIIKATRQRLRAWADLSAANSRGGFNAMNYLSLQYQAMTDAGEAQVDMDGLTPGRTDRPAFNLKSVPLPITHSDFFFSEREIAVSRNGGMPLDTAMAEMAARRVAEVIEQTLIGTVTGFTGMSPAGDPSTAITGSDKVYGYTNFPYRVTKTDLNTPTGSNPEAVKQDVIEMRETMYANGFYGPFILYTSTGYDSMLDDDYFRTGSTAIQRTTRERILSIEGISAIRRLDYLTSGYQMLLVQMTPDVAEAINGMDITTVQWESQGGMRRNFKIMAIQVPLLKSPYNGVAGIVHGTTS